MNDAAEYFHKHQNFANKWLHLLTMPMLIFTGQCYLQRYEIPVPEYMVDMAYDFAKKYGINHLLYIFAKPTMSPRRAFLLHLLRIDERFICRHVVAHVLGDTEHVDEYRVYVFLDADYASSD